MTNNVSDISTDELKKLIDSYFDSTITPEEELYLRQAALQRLSGAMTELSDDLDADLRLIASLFVMAEVDTKDVDVPAALEVKWNNAVAQAAAGEREKRSRFAFRKIALRKLIAAASVAVAVAIGWQLISDNGDMSTTSQLARESHTATTVVNKQIAARIEKNNVSCEQQTLLKKEDAVVASAANAANVASINSYEISASAVAPVAEEASELSAEENQLTIYYPATATLPADHDSRYKTVAQAAGVTSEIINEIGSIGFEDLSRISDAFDELFTTTAPSDEEEEPKFIHI